MQGTEWEAAVRYAAQRAEHDRQQAVDRLAALGFDARAASEVTRDIRGHARLTLNFHPDRHDSRGQTVAAGLLADGRYRFERTTCSVGDSHLGPSDVGTIDEMLSVLAGALEECIEGDGFGRNLSVSGFCETIGGGRGQQRSARELDRYIEAQVHGPIDLGTDVTAIHLDPSFHGSQVHRDLQTAAHRYGFELTWSEGSEVRPADIDPSFRGPEVITLAHQTTRDDGLVDAATIGRALAGEPFTPPSVEGDPEESPRQRYKKLWHCCLRFGTPPRTQNR